MDTFQSTMVIMINGFLHQSHLAALTKKTSSIKCFTTPQQQEKQRHLDTLDLSVCGEPR